MAENTRGSNDQPTPPPAEAPAENEQAKTPTPEQDAARAAELRAQLSGAEPPQNAAALSRELALTEARMAAAHEAAISAHRRAGLVAAGVVAADAGPVGPLPPLADGVDGGGSDRLVGAAVSQGSTYIFGERDIMAFRAGMAVKSYTFMSTYVTADANGRRILREGTTMASYTDGRAFPRATQAFIGINLHRLDLTDGDRDGDLLVGGHVKKRYITDNGTFGIAGDPAAALIAGEAGRAIFYHSNI